MARDTIFALSTILGKSGVAVIRISGHNSKQVLPFFNIKKKIQERVASLLTLFDTSNLPIDNVLLIYFKAPHSFTGEDVIELHTHGSITVINLLLKELSKIFRIAEPGEFSKRAFENNKMDLTQAEGLADLIDAETKMQARQALRQISGQLENLYDSWRHQLVNIIALIEAYIDFPDEEIPEQTTQEAEQALNRLIPRMEEHLHDNKRGEKLRDGFHVSIIGSTNSGKSTLFNYIAAQDMAIVSDVAGTTRDVIEVKIDLDGYPIILYDTAGIRSSLDPIEIEGIIRAKRCAAQADLKVALFAVENLHNPDQETLSIIDHESICIASKADNIPECNEIMIQDKKLLPVSVHNNRGIDILLGEIKTRVANRLAPSELPVITRERYRKAIIVAVEHLKRYNKEYDLVLKVEDLRMAARSIGQITGHIKVEEILDKVFSQFCIGK